MKLIHPVSDAVFHYPAVWHGAYGHHTFQPKMRSLDSEIPLLLLLNEYYKYMTLYVGNNMIWDHLAHCGNNMIDVQYSSSIAEYDVF